MDTRCKRQCRTGSRCSKRNSTRNHIQRNLKQIKSGNEADKRIHEIMCLYPRFTYNPKYKRNNKNGWEAPKLRDGRLLYVPIECKECIECRKNKSREWHARLMEDIKVHKNGIFVTLTFSNESLKKLSKDVKGRTDWETQNMIATRAVRLFLERWRKATKKKCKTLVNHRIRTQKHRTNTSTRNNMD